MNIVAFQWNHTKHEQSQSYSLLGAVKPSIQKQWSYSFQDKVNTQKAEDIVNRH